jgi:hypothetical protein
MENEAFEIYVKQALNPTPGLLTVSTDQGDIKLNEVDK